MADQKRWFKLWDSATSDDKITALPPALRWAWVALGAHTKVHGDNGTLTVSITNAVLAAKMGVELCDLEKTILLLPNIVVRRDDRDNGQITVIWTNWTKYQEDSTVYERLKKYRKRTHDNGLRGEEKRREEKRGEKSTKPPLSPTFEQIWNSYPRKTGKKSAYAVFERLDFSNGLLPKILTAIETQKLWPDWTKESGRFIPHLATWLNGERWNDEPPTSIDPLRAYAQAEDRKAGRV